nr:hypothetical protein Iba_chr14aCG24350 [Ipomoea batatas]GME15345.1 hypothetical protein Iba_scaffold16120CG0040 [Ipomoea batatas]
MKHSWYSDNPSNVDRTSLFLLLERRLHFFIHRVLGGGYLGWYWMITLLRPGQCGKSTPSHHLLELCEIHHSITIHVHLHDHLLAVLDSLALFEP